MEYIGIINRSGASGKYELPESRIFINPSLCLIPKIRNSLPFIYESWPFANKHIVRLNTCNLYSRFCVKANFTFGKSALVVVLPQNLGPSTNTTPLDFIFF